MAGGCCQGRWRWGDNKLNGLGVGGGGGGGRRKGSQEGFVVEVMAALVEVEKKVWEGGGVWTGLL
jgi:hypothetical protein